MFEGQNNLYLHIDPLNSTCFKANFKDFAVKNFVLLPLMRVNSKNAVIKPAKLVKFRFTVLHSSIFGKVRELVGEISMPLKSAPDSHKSATFNILYM